MALLLNTTTNPGTAVWTEASTLLVLGTPNRALTVSPNTLTISNPNNAWPLDLFSGEATTTVTAPSTGDWMATITLSVLRTGALAGTADEQSLKFNFTVDGVATGDVASYEAATTSAFTRPYILRQVLSLTAGQTVGVQWGWGAVQVASARAAVRILSIIPVV